MALVGMVSRRNHPHTQPFIIESRGNSLRLIYDDFNVLNVHMYIYIYVSIGRHRSLEGASGGFTTVPRVASRNEKQTDSTFSPPEKSSSIFQTCTHEPIPLLIFPQLLPPGTLIITTQSISYGRCSISPTHAPTFCLGQLSPTRLPKSMVKHTSSLTYH